MVPPYKKLRPLYTEKEVLVLLTEVEKRKDVIMAPISVMGSTTHRMREVAWESVAAAVNSHSDCQMTRTTKEWRTKFKDYKSDVKRKAKFISSRSSRPGFKGAKYTEAEEAMLRLFMSSSDTSLSILDSGNNDVQPQGKKVSKNSHQASTTKQAGGAGHGTEARLLVALNSSSAPAGGVSHTTEDPLSCPSVAAAKDSIIVISDNMEQIIPLTQHSGNDGTIASNQLLLLKPVPASPATTSLAGKEDTTSRLCAPPATTQSVGGEVRQVFIAPPSSPLCRPPSHGSAGTGTPPLGPENEAQPTSSVVQTQQEIRDLLSELVQQQKEAVKAQREAVLAQREAVVAQRETIAMAKEGIAVLQAVVEDHRQSTAAMLALGQVLGKLCKPSSK